MSEDTASGQVPFQDSRSNSSQAYLKRAASAVAKGIAFSVSIYILLLTSAHCAKASCRAKKCSKA